MNRGRAAVILVTAASVIAGCGPASAGGGPETQLPQPEPVTSPASAAAIAALNDLCPPFATRLDNAVGLHDVTRFDSTGTVSTIQSGVGTATGLCIEQGGQFLADTANRGPTDLYPGSTSVDIVNAHALAFANTLVKDSIVDQGSGDISRREFVEFLQSLKPTPTQK